MNQQWGSVRCCIAIISFSPCYRLPCVSLRRLADCRSASATARRPSIKSVETRLENAPDSGSAVSFRNGGYQVSYDTVPAIVHSKAGDPVRMCLVSIPKHCPKGDHRGKVYRTTNLRTHKSWKLMDSEHMCGGA